MSIWPFKKKPEGSLGVDIGTSSVKIVELGQYQKRTSLVNYGIYNAATKSGVGGGAIQTSSLKVLGDEVIEIIGDLIEKAKFKSKEAVFAVPVFSTFTTIIDLPMMPRAEIDKAIRFKAKQYIPIPLSEVVYDWDFVGMNRFKDAKGSSTKKLEKARIVLVAVPNEIINKYINIAKSVGLNLSGIESETFSLMRSLLGGDQSAACLVDIGSRNTNIAVVDKGSLSLNRNMDTSGIEFTKVISQGMGISLERAEEIKRSEGVKGLLSGNTDFRAGGTLRGEKEASSIVHPIIDIIVQEVNRIVNIHRKREGKDVDKIVLAGGSSNLPGLDRYMAKKLNKSVFIGNPLSKIIYPVKLSETLRIRHPRLAVAVGAAMRNI